jgi:predicted N-acetyltransferase YhbS
MTMVTIRPEREVDEAAREQLLDAAYGPIRFKKPSHRLREGREPAAGLSFVAVMDGRAVGTVRLWPVEAGAGRPALLLGPLAVDHRYRKRGVGSALMQRALRDVGKRGHHAVLLVGDPAYYGRFGFSAEKTGKLWLLGPYEQHRLLGCELVAGALDGAGGLIRAPKVPAAKPASRLAPLVAAMTRRRPTPHTA